MEETTRLRMALGGGEYRVIHRQPFAKIVSPAGGAGLKGQQCDANKATRVRTTRRGRGDGFKSRYAYYLPSCLAGIFMPNSASTSALCAPKVGGAW